ncbi:6-carboxytetrahydropterin synthase [Elioraea tepidiphila]|uniref:6-pyruvoyl trahydropterin synthase family protein n=1 Tax=Elioraea tepidiphila TaxID=457934 RepID=UPI002FD97FD8
MFSLTVCDHVMIAHSFRGEVFGPAQKLHGATYAVEAEFRVPTLDEHGLVVDIGLARTELRRALDSFDYDNLDALPQFAGQNTTTEFMAAHVHGLLVAALKKGRLGDGGKRVTALKVLLRESPLAWAAYEAAVE